MGMDPYHAPAAVFSFSDIRLLQGHFNHPLRDLVCTKLISADTEFYRATYATSYFFV